MKLFGVFILIYVMSLILSKKSTVEKYITLIGLLASLELFVNAGYMFSVGEYELLYKEFVLVIVIIYSLFFILTKRIEKKMLLFGILLLNSIIVTEVLLTINPLNQEILRNSKYIVPEMAIYSLLITLRIVFIILIALALKIVLNRENLVKIVNYIYKFGSLILVVCYTEWVTKNLFKSEIFINVVTDIFGKGRFTVDTILTRGSLHSIQGFMREPAHLTEGIFYCLVLIILSNIEKKRINKFLLMALPLLLLSGSFSVLIYVGCLFIIYIAKNRITPVPVSIITLAIVVIIPFFITTNIFQYYVFRLTNSLNFFNANDAALLLTSEGVRINSIIETFKVFIKRPLFGIGLGMPYSYGFISVFLASVGSFGVILWFQFIFNVFGEVKINTKIIFVIIAISVSWMFTGNIENAYSIVTLLIAFSLGEMSKNNIFLYESKVRIKN